MRLPTLLLALAVYSFCAFAHPVTQQEMRRVYDEVKTPYKYGIVVSPDSAGYMTDSPTVFRLGGKWMMTYIQFEDGRGYQTYIAESPDLLHWTKLGCILPFPADASRWDYNQRAGYMALVDNKWGGSYRARQYDGKYWLSYLGGAVAGYESDPLCCGMAWCDGNISDAQSWHASERPVMRPDDGGGGWYDAITLYKSQVIDDPKHTLGARFVMFYNAAGVNPSNDLRAERISIALSDDLMHWRRYNDNPVFAHEMPDVITGDAVVQRMGDLYVMFYFGAFWPDHKSKAFNTFACSRDLVHWTDWTGDELISPSEPYDARYAHKSSVVKWRGTVYHFYCAVSDSGERCIALATSKPKK